jgi:hypothetical protein
MHPEGPDAAGEPDPFSRVPPGIVYAGVVVMVVATIGIVVFSFLTGAWVMGLIGLGILGAMVFTSRPKGSS